MTLKKPVILCVDDEQVILTGLKDQLIRYFGDDYTIEIAESGQEALELLEELLAEKVEVPVIISDQIMPGMKGDEMLINIHQRYPQALKIFLTGQADVKAVGNAVNYAGLWRYISKPWDESDLKLTITKALYSYTRDKQFSEQNMLLEKLYDQAQQEIAERKRIEVLLAEANQNLEEKVKERTRELSEALEKLRNTQNRLIIQEKMASLGTLTAGIAHEIKNPLNFVNSFAKLSSELVAELGELIETQKERLTPELLEDIFAVLDNLRHNVNDIYAEGRRADNIIHTMLLHARTPSGEPQETDVNVLLREAVNLAYHSMRSKDGYFDIRIEEDYDSDLKPLCVMPQDLSRVFVNFINNAYDAMRDKKKTAPDSYEPVLMVGTRQTDDSIDIRIRDNGTGISRNIRSEIFNPFFTTKPAGEGTGLGLSISYNIIVQGHGGTIETDSKTGEYSEFVIRLPKKEIRNAK